MQKKEALENVLNDFRGSFLQVLYVEDFGDRSPPQLGVFVQADVHGDRAELPPTGGEESEQQQHRSPELHDGSEPRRGAEPTVRAPAGTE